MEKKLKLNVVSVSRDKRFLVLAEREWSLDLLRQCTEDVFHRLYPTEPEMHLSAMQNEFHSDIPLNYQVGDVLADAGLIFAVEEENASKCFSSGTFLKTSSDEDEDSKSTSRKKTCRKRAGSKSKEQESCSSDRVTSTTSPTLIDEGSNLTPQLVEKICEDSEVDIETVEEESQAGMAETHKVQQLTENPEQGKDNKTKIFHKVNTRKRKKSQQKSSQELG